MKLNLGLIAGIILLVSIAIPWTVASGMTTIDASTSYDWIQLEFPFMGYFSVPRMYSEWYGYEFAPRYLGIILIVIGGILAVIGSLKREHESLLRWGGVLGILAPIFFIGCSSANITIDYPTSQSYTIIPVGAFIPALFWILVLISARREAIVLKPTPELFCSQCGSNVSPEFNLCPFCGSKLVKPTKLVCPVCGKENPVEYAFCLYCGAKLK